MNLQKPDFGNCTERSKSAHFICNELLNLLDKYHYSAIIINVKGKQYIPRQKGKVKDHERFE